MSLVVQQQEYSLRVDMQDYKGLSRYAEYKTFQLKGPESDYAMIIDGYTGDAGKVASYVGYNVIYIVIYIYYYK